MPRILVRLAVAHPAKVAPSAAAKVVAGAVREKSSTPRRVRGKVSAWQNVAWRSEVLDAREISSGRFVSMGLAALATYRYIECHEKGSHQLMIATSFCSFEEPFDQRVVARAIERFVEIGENLSASPRPSVLQPPFRKCREYLWNGEFL
jgi:hypothetical protein